MRVLGKFGLVTAALGLLAGISSTSHAALIAYEGFNYNEGTLVGASGGTGWTGSWTSSGGTSSVVAPGSTYSTLITEGNKAFISNSNSNTRTFSSGIGGPAVDDTVWFSFIGQRANTQTRAVWFGLYEGANPKMLIGEPSNASGDVWRVEFGGSGGLGPISTTSINDEVFVLVRVDYNAAANDDFYMWIDPDLSAGEPTTLSPSFVGSNIGGYDLAFDNVNLRGLTTSSGNTGSVWFDEIRFGDTFADVTPVPEPGSMILAMFGLSSVVALARRKQK